MFPLLVFAGILLTSKGSDALVLSQARHPVMESLVPDFQPNDTFLGPMCRFRIITGKNTAGKSTYLRQTCLVTIMAHMGSFVPAEFCTTKPFRQLFTRIGTEDDLEANASTFTVEMKEIAYILESATEDSLIIIDELGRGTANTDGAALAWAISEQMVCKASYVLFATHFHELTEMSQIYEQIHNSHLGLSNSGAAMTASHVLVDGFAI